MDDEDVVEELESLSAYEEPFVQQVWIPLTDPSCDTLLRSDLRTASATSQPLLYPPDIPRCHAGTCRILRHDEHDPHL